MASKKEAGTASDTLLGGQVDDEGSRHPGTDEESVEDNKPDDSSSSSLASSSGSREHHEQELHEGLGSSSGADNNGWDFDSDEDNTSVEKGMIRQQEYDGDGDGSEGVLQQEQDDEEDMPPLVEKTHCIENKSFDQVHRRGEVYKMPAARKDDFEDGHILLWPVGFIISTIGFQMKLLGYSFSLAMLLLNISYSLVTEPIHRTVQAKNKVTGKISDGISIISHAHTVLWETIYDLGPKLNGFISRIGYGVLAAAYVCAIMSSLVVPAILIDVLFVSRFVEEPVQSKVSLHFDYTEPRPSALVPLFPQSVIIPRDKDRPIIEKKGLWILRSIPKSHRFHITVSLTLPESDHNVQLGMFQVSAEIMSVEGLVLARFTQPCMLGYRSRPIRYVRTFIVAVPLVLGLEAETQTLVLSLVESYEDLGSDQAGSVRIMLEPRAGFQPGEGLPELYDAEIVVQSRLPPLKSLIYNWKWTFYVWSGITLFLVELVCILCCCRHTLIPSPRVYNGGVARPHAAIISSAPPGDGPGRGRGLRRKKVTFQDDLPRARAAAAGVGTTPNDIENFVQLELEALSGTKEKLSRCK